VKPLLGLYGSQEMLKYDDVEGDKGFVNRATPFDMLLL